MYPRNEKSGIALQAELGFVNHSVAASAYSNRCSGAGWRAMRSGGRKGE
jgi:hypothetical protein